MSNTEQPLYTEGIAGDGAAILKDGVPITISEILATLNNSVTSVEEAAGFEGNFSDRAKELLAEYKPSITKEQKTPSNMFILGAEAALLKYCPQVSEWSKEYSGRTANFSAEEAAVKSAEETLDEKFIQPETQDWYKPVLAAMLEYASQFQASRSKGVGMQWVDAKDRLPSAGIRVPVKYNGEYYKGFRNHDSVNPSMYIILCNGSELTRDCEWLDESAPLSDNSQEEGREALNKINHLVKSIKSADPDLYDNVIKDLYKQATDIQQMLSASPGSEGKEEKKCPYCGCRDVIMFTSDDDACNGCGKYFPAV